MRVTAFAGEAGSVGEVEVVVETGVLGALFWTGLSGSTVTEEVTTCSGGRGTVFTTATVGDAPPSVKKDRQSSDLVCLLIYILTNNHHFFPSFLTIY